MMFWPGCCCKEEPCAEICTTVTGGGGGGLPLAGAAVSFTLGGSPAGSCTTDAGGKCCVPVSAPGTYDGTASKSGYASATFSVVVAEGECDVLAPVTKTKAVNLTADAELVLLAKGCGGRPLPGASVVVTRTGDGAAIGTFTSGLDGLVYIHPLDLGVEYGYTMSRARFDSYSTTFTLSTGGTNGPYDDGNLVPSPMTLAAGYLRCCQCPAPWPNTIYAQDAQGTHTIADYTVQGFCYAFSSADVAGANTCYPTRTATISVGYEVICTYDSTARTVTYKATQYWIAQPCHTDGVVTSYLLAVPSEFCVGTPGKPATTIPDAAWQVSAPTVTQPADACSPMLLSFTFPSTITHPSNGLSIPVAVPGTIVWSE